MTPTNIQATPRFFRSKRWKLYLMASASTAEPSWNLALSASLMVQVVASGLPTTSVETSGFSSAGLALVAQQAVVDRSLPPRDGIVVAGVRIEIADILPAAVDEDVGIRLSTYGSYARRRGERRHDRVVAETGGYGSRSSNLRKVRRSMLSVRKASCRSAMCRSCGS